MFIFELMAGKSVAGLGMGMLFVKTIGYQAKNFGVCRNRLILAFGNRPKSTSVLPEKFPKPAQFHSLNP